jgi:hypothetical protein
VERALRISACWTNAENEHNRTHEAYPKSDEKVNVIIEKPGTGENGYENSGEHDDDDIPIRISLSDFAFGKQTGDFSENDVLTGVIRNVRAFSAKIVNVK